MNRIAVPESPFPRVGLVALVLAGALTGVTSAFAVWMQPAATVLAVFVAAAACVGLITFSVAGFYPIAAATLGFFLMNRFEETWVIPIGNGISIPPTYWCAALAIAALIVHLLIDGVSPTPRDPTLRRFLPRFTRLLGAFYFIGLLAIAVNHATDSAVTDRYLPGELLALTGICFPLLFVVLLPRTKLPRERTLLCLRGIIGLGAFGGLIMALFGLFPDQMMARLGWAEMTGGTLDLVRGRLPLGHPNKVAAITLLLLPVTTTLGLGARKMSWRLLHLGATALMFCGVLFALSRSALLSMTLVMMLTFAYFLLARENRRLWILVLAIILGAALMGAAAYLFARFDFSRFWSRGYFEEASVERRADSMTTALYVWWDHPFLGVSPDAVYPRIEYRPGWAPDLQDRISPVFYYDGHPTAETPHNFCLNLLAEFGIVGTALFLAILVLILYSLWHARRLPYIDPFEKKTLAGLSFGILAFLTMGMFDAMLMTGFRANVVFWAFVGLAMRYTFAVEESSRARAAQESSAEPAP